MRAATLVPGWRPFLLRPVRDPSARQVVRRQFDLHLVSREDADEVHPHLARDVREHLVAVIQHHAEHRVGEGLHHRPLYFDGIILRQASNPLPGPRTSWKRGGIALWSASGKRPARENSDSYQPTVTSSHFTRRPARLHAPRVSTSAPPSVMRMVCSKWADNFRSAVTAVQSSSRISTSWVPWLTMGSTARTIPARSFIPAPACPWLGTWGCSWSFRPIPWPVKSRTTAYPLASTCFWTACPISPSRLPGFIAWMAFWSASRVVSSSDLASADTFPTGTVLAASPNHPL